MHADRACELLVAKMAEPATRMPISKASATSFVIICPPLPLQPLPWLAAELRGSTGSNTARLQALCVTCNVRIFEPTKHTASGRIARQGRAAQRPPASIERQASVRRPTMFGRRQKPPGRSKSCADTVSQVARTVRSYSVRIGSNASSRLTSFADYPPQRLPL